MRIFNKNNKKSGFTLMEIAIAVMIVGLLTAIVIPIVRNQVAKLDEYSYYAAYKAVEKLGGQIVALGLDPCVTNPNSNECRGIAAIDGQNVLTKNKIATEFDINKKVKFFISTIGDKFVYSEQYLFKKLFPKSYADDDDGWDILFDWTDDDYQEANLRYRLCNGEKIYVQLDENGNQKKDAMGNLIYETADSFFGSGACVGYTKAGTASVEGGESTSTAINSALERFYNKQYCTIDNSTLAGYIRQKSNENNAKTFCSSYIAPKCKKVETGETNIEYKYKWFESSPAYTYFDEEEKRTVTEPATYTCQILRKNNSPNEGYNGTDTNWERPAVASNVCAGTSGYFQMYNAGAPYYIDCQCSAGKDPTENNDKFCCTPRAGYKCYAKLDSISSNYVAENTAIKYCPNNSDFNQNTKECCADYSRFNGVNCQCINGYRTDPRSGSYSDGSPKACQQASCVGGSHLETDEFGNTSCVANSPIIKANDLCRSINHYWQTRNSSCNFTTTGSNNLAVNNAVYEAAKGTNNRYLSVASKEGAFNAITPNIELMNGLRLWILGDKTASIPGLSFNPASITTNTQNMCIDLNKNTKQSCTAAGGYFCSSENHCFKLDNIGMGSMGDARNCCASTDLTTLAYADPTNYEKDNRAFAISGFTVFVDINGSKGSGTLWEDVFPFYIGANGTVYPGYPLDGIKSKDAAGTSLYIAGNGVQDLSVDVFYYETHGSYRQKVMAYPNVSYARGACFAKKVKAYTPYCQNLGLKSRDSGNNSADIKGEINSNSNPCNSQFCQLSVRKKVRFF